MHVSKTLIGKKVKWTSKSGGYATTKTGKIIDIPPIDSAPLLYAIEKYPRHRLMFDTVVPVAQGKQRYLVEVLEKNRKEKLYYPRTGQLKLIS